MSGNDVRIELQKREAARKNMQVEFRQVVALEQIADDLHAIRSFLVAYLVSADRR